MPFLILHDPAGRLVGVRFAGAVPCTIGRGSENALVVDDAFVDHRHAEVVRRDDGALLVRDLGSVNGLRRPGDATPTAELVLEDGAPIQLGQSLLQLVAEAPVRALPLPATGGTVPGWAARNAAPALADADVEVPGVVAATAPAPAPATPAVPRWLALARRRAVQVGLPLALALAGGVTEAVQANSLRPALDGTWLALGVLALLLLWAAGWALGTRLRIGEGRFGTHLAVAAMASAAVVVIEWLAGWADYLQPAGWATIALGGAGVLAGWWLLLHLHLRVIRPAGGGRLPAIATGLAFAFSACTLGLPALAEDFTTQAEFTATLKSTPPGLVPVTGARRYADDLEALRRTLDEDTDTLDTLGELVRPGPADSTAAPDPAATTGR